MYQDQTMPDTTSNLIYIIVTPDRLEKIQSFIPDIISEEDLKRIITQAKETAVNQDGKEVKYKMAIKLDAPENLTKSIAECISLASSSSISSITKKTAKGIISTKIENRVKENANKKNSITLPIFISIIKSIDTTLTLSRMAEISGITESTLKRWKKLQPKTKPTTLGDKKNDGALERIILEVITRHENTVDTKRLNKLLKQLRKQLKSNVFESTFKRYKDTTDLTEAKQLAEDIVENLKESFREELIH